MKRTENNWSKAAVLICTKCQKAMDPKLLSESGDMAENLKNKLKVAMKESGKAKEIRVMTSSCLSICEADLQAVCIVPVDTAALEMESLAIHPEKEYSDLLNKLKQL